LLAKNYGKNFDILTIIAWSLMEVHGDQRSELGLCDAHQRGFQKSLSKIVRISNFLPLKIGFAAKSSENQKNCQQYLGKIGIFVIASYWIGVNPENCQS